MKRVIQAVHAIQMGMANGFLIRGDDELTLIDAVGQVRTRDASTLFRDTWTGNPLADMRRRAKVLMGAKLIEHQSRAIPREIASIALQSASAAFAEVVKRWRLIDRSDLRTIHRTRVAFKRFRYIVESLPPELTGFSKRDLRNLARCQRAMGNIQDFEVIQACVMSFIKRHENVGLDAFCGYLKSQQARAVRSFLQKSDGLPQLWLPEETPERQTSIVPSDTFNS